MPESFYAIIPKGKMPFLDQKQYNFAFNHFANHRASGDHLIYINEGNPNSFNDDTGSKTELSGVTTSPALPEDYATHWEQVLQPGTDLTEIEDNFRTSTAEFVVKG